MKFIDLAGQRFGRLIVIKRIDNKGVRIMWLCRCDCGNEATVASVDLRRGNTKSCGCLQKEKGTYIKLPLGIANMRKTMKDYKRRAEKNGYNFNLTEEQFAELTKRPCHYCGANPNNITKLPRCNGVYTYNGIDRVDNEKGYVISNVVSCCKTCNSAKGRLTLQEFRDWIGRVSNFALGGDIDVCRK